MYRSCGSFYDHTVYRFNVVNAIRSLCAGKSVDDICSDNLKHATDRFIDYIVSLFNSILSHRCVPIRFLSSTIIPIPKNPRFDLKNSENYRAIALSSVFGKNFEFLFIEKQVEQLGTSESQFGYITSVSHINKLFNTLQAHGVFPFIIRVLYNMYRNSDMQVRWKSEHSNVFPLMNGVKQGGCLSPMLFTLYLNGLIQKLKHSGIGCRIGRTLALCPLWPYVPHWDEEDK